MFSSRVAQSTFLVAGALCESPAPTMTRTALFTADALSAAARAAAITDDTTATVATADAASAPAQADSQPLHAAAVEHSDAYRTRAKIHKIASFATLPLFAGEVALGQSVYNSNGGNNKSAHILVGSSIIGLFAVNTITGSWNLFGEDRQEHSGRTLRLVHGLLMMAAGGGFVATAMTGPHHDREGVEVAGVNASTHRAIALSSIGVGTVGYLVMLFGNH